MAGPSFSFGKGIQQATSASLPTCNPCREKDHGRCATVLAKNHIIDSAFECACFGRDEDEHGAAFRERQEAFEDDHFGRADWDSEGRSHYSRFRGSMRDVEFYTGEFYGDR